MSIKSAFIRSSAVALFFVLAVGLITGCTPVGAAIGVGATAGVAAYEERSLEQNARDKKAELQISANWLAHEAALATKLSIDVYENRAMVTGQLPSQAEMAEALRLVWRIPTITEVYNEIQIAPSGDLLDTAKDGWITTKLRTLITADDEIYAINYSIETVDGVVYLIGVGQTQAEIDRVRNHAREISGVRKVISHVRVKAPPTS